MKPSISSPEVYPRSKLLASRFFGQLREMKAVRVWGNGIIGPRISHFPA